jgi:hypothetical protein
VAIAFDAAASRDFGATLTWTHTCAASATLLYVGVRDDTGDAGLSVTYNSVAMTLVNTVVSDGVHTYKLFRLLSPSSGANTVSVTTSAGNIGGVSSSYISTHATPQDVNGTSGPTSAATISLALTATGSNEWAVLFVADRSGSAPTANANLAIRATPSAATSMAIGDSNGNTMTAGVSFTMTANIGGTTGVTIGEAFKPPLLPSMLAVF